ncbi:MAG: chorismate-binding protein, partial [Candidatus Hydrogenedentes bacterium]|nr:chorismate-binding protein [Candidatus Hydrogenedentota bacterium]
MRKDSYSTIKFNSALAIINSVEYRFPPPLEIQVAYSEEEILPLIRKLEGYSYEGKVALGWLSYEGSWVFDPVYPRRPSLFHNMPYACFAIFDSYSTSPVDYISTERSEKAVFPEWVPLITKEEYIQGVLTIKDNIGRGNVYQVNFTFPFESEFEGDLHRLFRRLCFAQGKGYFIFLDTPPFAVLSISPELFFCYERNKLVVRPMKGTRPRGRSIEEDIFLRKELENSEKEKAENLMIV